MATRLCCWIIFGWAGLLSAQLPTYEYFPAAMCKKEGLKIVTVYETQVDDAVATPLRGNPIKLARNMVRQNEYDAHGHNLRSLRFVNEGKNLTLEVLRTFTPEGLLVTEIQRQYNTNLSDSTKLIQSDLRTYYRDQAQSPTATVHVLLGKSGTSAIDSTVYALDAQGRLAEENSYDQLSLFMLLQSKQYHYEADKIIVETRFGGSVLNRDEYLLDAQGRIVKERNFSFDEATPRLETDYVFDKGGLLIELRYAPDWKFFQPASTVVLRKNKFDAHGKLLEAQLDYGGGKRLFEFYDYGYWSEK